MGLHAESQLIGSDASRQFRIAAALCTVLLVQLVDKVEGAPLLHVGDALRILQM